MLKKKILCPLGIAPEKSFKMSAHHSYSTAELILASSPANGRAAFFTLGSDHYSSNGATDHWQASVALRGGVLFTRMICSGLPLKHGGLGG